MLYKSGWLLSTAPSEVMCQWRNGVVGTCLKRKKQCGAPHRINDGAPHWEKINGVGRPTDWAEAVTLSVKYDKGRKKGV